MRGSRDLFVSFMEEYHPGATLLHVKDAKGKMQYISCEVSRPTHINLKYYVHFLESWLKS